MGCFYQPKFDSSNLIYWYIDFCRHGHYYHYFHGVIRFMTTFLVLFDAYIGTRIISCQTSSLQAINTTKTTISMCDSNPDSQNCVEMYFYVIIKKRSGILLVSCYFTKVKWFFIFCPIMDKLDIFMTLQLPIQYIVLI